MTEDCVQTYQRRFPDLEQVAKYLEALLRRYLDNLPRIDRIAARAKSIESFAAKAAKQRDDGAQKYSAPLSQIQDQIAARVVVFFEADVDAVGEIVEQYFRPVERRTHVPDSYWEFGYFGKHWILALPPDVIPRELKPGELPPFFELQVKTLFQHAWSEASHDLAYKPVGALEPEHQRRFAFSAAQAWGADREFRELFVELGPGRHGGAVELSES